MKAAELLPSLAEQAGVRAAGRGRGADGHLGGRRVSEGMFLGGEVRGPDVGVWTRQPGTSRSRRYRATPPLLAIEVAGADDAENEEALRAKALWYLTHGVRCVWLVLPATREVVVLLAHGESRLREKDVVPEPPELPGLSVPVAALFATL